MREIKFRGKYLDDGEFVYGYYIYVPEIDDLFPNKIVGDGVTLDIDKDTVGQFIGLKDKNGVEIYEGDIVLTQPFRDKPFSPKYKEKRLKGIVEYNILSGDNFCGDEGKMKYFGAEWSLKIIDKKDYEKFCNFGWGKFFECEVIGNIHDNPELLKEE